MPYQDRIIGHGKENPQDLLANPKNWRIHPATQEAALAGVLKEVGWVSSIMVNQRTGFVVDGHLRVAHAISSNEPEVPVTYVDLSEDEEALVIATLDPLGALAGRDQQQLDELIASLDPDSLDPAIATLLHDLESKERQKQLPKFPDSERVETPVVRTSDLWSCGGHRLLCGDSSNSADVAFLLAGRAANMIFTDPPYNADYSSRVDEQRRKPWGGIVNDNMSPAAYRAFLGDAMTTLFSSLEDGGSIYVTIDWKRYATLSDLFGALFQHKGTIVWDKTHFGLGTYYRTQYELVVFGCKGEKLKQWHAEHDERDVWQIPRDALSDYEHPTQKPPELVARAIQNSSARGDMVLDLFGGSGTTLLAAEATGRVCYMMEIDPRWAQVSLQRWAKLTGLDPVREDGVKLSSLIEPKVLVASNARSDS